MVFRSLIRLSKFLLGTLSHSLVVDRNKTLRVEEALASDALSQLNRASQIINLP